MALLQAKNPQSLVVVSEDRSMLLVIYREAPGLETYVHQKIRGAQIKSALRSAGLEGVPLETVDNERMARVYTECKIGQTVPDQHKGLFERLMPEADVPEQETHTRKLQ